MKLKVFFATASVLSLLIIFSSYYLVDGAIELAASFVTVRSWEHDMVTTAVFTFLSMVVSDGLLYIVYHLGRHARRRMLYHEVDVYDEGVTDGQAAAESTVKVMYKDSTPCLEKIAASAHEEVRDLASYSAAKEWFRKSGEEVRDCPKAITRRCENDRRVKESETRLYAVLGINPNNELTSARDRLYQAFGIHAD